MNLTRQSQIAILSAISIVAMYAMVYAAILFGIPSAKLALTGSVGPNTYFYGTVVICPLAFLVLGFLFSRKSFAFNLILISLAALITWFSYSDLPLMDLKRQLTNDIPGFLLVLYLAGAFSTVLIFLRSLKDRDQDRFPLPKQSPR